MRGSEEGEQPKAQLPALLPIHGFDTNMQNFADAFISLQEQRHRADYDPSSTFRTAIAEAEIVRALQARQAFNAAPIGQRRVFLTLVIAPPR